MAGTRLGPALGRGSGQETAQRGTQTAAGWGFIVHACRTHGARQLHGTGTHPVELVQLEARPQRLMNQHRRQQRRRRHLRRSRGQPVWRCSTAADASCRRHASTEAAGKDPCSCLVSPHWVYSALCECAWRPGPMAGTPAGRLRLRLDLLDRRWQAAPTCTGGGSKVPSEAPPAVEERSDSLPAAIAPAAASPSQAARTMPVVLGCRACAACASTCRGQERA